MAARTDKGTGAHEERVSYTALRMVHGAQHWARPGVGAVEEGGPADVAKLAHHMCVLDVLLLRVLATGNPDDVLHQVLRPHHVVFVVREQVPTTMQLFLVGRAYTPKDTQIGLAHTALAGGRDVAPTAQDRSHAACNVACSDLGHAQTQE